ncbi:MAG: hypothetical protein KJZ75_11555 [Hyphomonadaceae bacterium]|nr:hypothetical protein [Hyphomonadaceae bacterium]
MTDPELRALFAFTFGGAALICFFIARHHRKRDERSRSLSEEVRRQISAEMRRPR